MNASVRMVLKAAGTTGAGLLMSGVLTFDENGNLINDSAYTAADRTQDLTDPASWTTASFDAHGAPEMTADLTNGNGATASLAFSLNFGLTNDTASWDSGSGTSAASVGTDPANLATFTGNLNSVPSTAGAAQTDTVTKLVDGSAGGSDASPDANPFFSLIDAWDGSGDDIGLEDEEYEIRYDMQIYDEEGNSYTVSIMFERATIETGDGKQYWEYVVAFEDPSNDAAAASGSDGSGLLMAGTMTFESGGELESMTAFTPTEDSNKKDLSTWTLAEFDENGLPVFDVVFPATDDNGDPLTTTISMDFGISNTGDGWATGADLTAQDIGTSFGSLPTFDADVAELATTAYSGTAFSQYTDQDGYPDGFLYDVTVDENGMLSGIFSNGRTVELWQIPVFTFTNEYGLRAEGGNLWSSTTNSGEAIVGAAGMNGNGSIHEYSLEMSNVDMAQEFASMIMLQRGYQANGKIITTSDAMITTATGLKKEGLAGYISLRGARPWRRPGLCARPGRAAPPPPASSESR